MENGGKINPSELKIQGLLDRYLRFQSKKDGLDGRAHLDEDSLTAFVEGNLGEREAQPMIAHLVDCSFCRHVTAELVKLDLAFAEETQPAPAESQPTKVSEVLSGILSRLFGTNDGAVFAHHEEEEKSEEEEDKKE